MGYVLGLDIGSNSVGWAMIDIERETIVNGGARVFTMGVENANTEKEESRNVKRRMSRQLRRQYERRRQRKRQVRRLLIESGLLPADPQMFEQIVRQDPYTIRARGLDQPLTLFEVGRLVDHLNSKRGFKSNRRAQSQEEHAGTIYEGADNGSKPGINAIDEAIDPQLRTMSAYRAVRGDILAGDFSVRKGYRTAGEYLASLDPHIVRRRCRFTLREHFEIELDMLLALQARHHPEILTPALCETIMKTVFFQRPLRSMRGKVGKCTFEPGKKRVHKSHPDFQRFRMLQQLNKLRIFGGSRIDEEECRLTASERETLITHLQTQGSLDLEKSPRKIKDLLGLDKKTDYVFNIDKLDAPTTWQRIQRVMGQTWLRSLDPERLYTLWNVLDFASDESWLQGHLEDIWDLNGEQAKALAKIRMEDGYGSLSRKAVGKILPWLEEGHDYHEACALAGYDHANPDDSPEVLADRVPALASEDARNPIVQTSFAEMRKVVNAIIRTYGHPDSIRVEMARELKQPRAERIKFQKIQKENERENERLRTLLHTEFGLDERPSREDMQRYKLWEAQNMQCIYTGTTISRTQLFSGAADVDHILPYSRTLDDSMANKVLCLRDINARKGDLSPWEAGQQGILDTAQLRERVEALVRVNKMTKGKSRRFFMDTEEMGRFIGNDFITRQLNDTRFTSRLAIRYLRYVCRDVSVSNGSLTAALRRRWGLNGVLLQLAEEGKAWLDPDARGVAGKNRADHRHHAIDAVVIALTDRGMLQRVSTLNAREGAPGGGRIDLHRIQLPDSPLPGLPAMTRRMVENIVVSHRVQRKVRGQLHEETLYGVAHDHAGVPLTNEGGVQLYVVRKPIESLTCNELQNVVDPAVKSRLFAHLEALGVDVSVPKFNVPKNAFLEPVYLLRRDGTKGPVIRRARIYKPSNGMRRIKDWGVYVEPGSNDRMVIEHTAEKGKRLWTVHTLFDAVRGVKRIHGMSDRPVVLRRNEMFIPDYVLSQCDLDASGIKGEIVKSVFRVQLMDGIQGQMTFRHAAAALLNDNASRKLLSPSTMVGTKVAVDVLGRLKVSS